MTGGHLLFKRVIIFLSLNAVFFSNATASLSKADTDSPPIQSNDLAFAQHLNKLHKQLAKAVITPAEIAKANKYAKRSKIFHIYHPLLQKLKSISKNNIRRSLVIKTCNEIREIKEINERPIFNKTLDLANHFCIRKYLRMRVYGNSKIRRFTKLEEDLLKKNLGPLLAGRHTNNFIKLLDKIEEHSSAQKFVSKIITSFYMNLNEVPNRKIVSHIIVDEYLTAYIQLKGLVDKKALDFFKGEFQSLYKSLIKDINSDQNDTKIKKSIDYLIGFYNTNKHYISPNTSMAYFSTIIKKLISRNKLTLANDLSKDYLSLAPHLSKNDAIFFRIWTLLRTRRPQDALTVVKENNLIENFSQLDSRLRYWTAITLKKSDKWSQAKEFFYKQIKLTPINYYSILSFKELQGFSKDIDPQNLFTLSDVEREKSQETSLKVYNDVVSRLEIWMRIHNDNFVIKEVDTFLKREYERIKNHRHLASVPSDANNVKSAGKRLTLRLINYLNKKKKYLTTFKVLYSSIEQNIIDVNEEILRFLFPFQYVETIKKIDNTIDPLIVLSLIRQESAFNPTARSIVGARGLMQLMPQTAKRFKSRVRPHHLKRPKLNIRIGIQLLKVLFKKYNGNLIYVLAAYNAGEGNANQWIKNRFTGKNAEDIIEEIPFKETRLYVKLIYRNLFFYNMLAGKSDFIAKKKSKTFYTVNY